MISGASLATHCLRARGAALLFPFELEQVLEEVVAPLRGGGGPGHFQPAGDGVLAMSTAEVAGPAQALRFDRATLGFRALVRFRRRAVRLAEGVATGDQRDDFLVVHGHAVEGGADVLGRGHVVAAGVRAFGVHIDQAHVRRAQALDQDAVALEALVIAQPLRLGGPSYTSWYRLPTRPRGRRRSRTCESPSIPAPRCRRGSSGRPRKCCWPYFCLIGHSRRRALSRLTLSGQLLSGAKRCWPRPPPPRPSVDAVGAGASARPCG
jgi:hypothetical protein